MKKKVLGFISVISVVAFSIVGTNFIVSDNAKDVCLLMKNTEAVANSPEDGPGNYKGAINSYCTKPKGEKGCKSTPETTKICTYSVYCTE